MYLHSQNEQSLQVRTKNVHLSLEGGGRWKCSKEISTVSLASPMKVYRMHDVMGGYFRGKFGEVKMPWLPP